MTKIEDAVAQWWKLQKKTAPERTAIAQLKRDYTKAGRGARVLANEINRYTDATISPAGLLIYLKKHGLKTEASRFQKAKGPTKAQLEAEIKKLKQQETVRKKAAKRMATALKPYKQEERRESRRHAEISARGGEWGITKRGRRERAAKEALREKYL